MQCQNGTHPARTIMPKRARASSPIALLEQLAGSSSRANQLAALECLEHLADSEDKAEYEQVHAVAAEVAASLVALLEGNRRQVVKSREHADLTLRAVSVLRHLTFFDETIHAVEQAGAIPLLVDLLSCTCVQTRRCATIILYHLAMVCDTPGGGRASYWREVVEAGAVRPLTRLLHDDVAVADVTHHVAT